MSVLSAYHAIVFYEWLPALMGRLKRKLKTKRNKPPLRQVNDIDHFLTTPARGHVLVILIPQVWINALAAGDRINVFNIDGLTLEVVKAFNSLGFLVDIVDWSDPGADPPKKRYDAVFAHGPNCEKRIEALPPDTPVIHYVSGAYWKAFNRMSQERYDAFCLRNNLPKMKDFTRSLSGTEDGEEYLARRANFTFISGPRTIGTFAGISSNIELLYLGSYVDRELRNIRKDFASGRKSFIYVAGTSGNIQKGMDILIEAFSQLPDLNLYIYCMVEGEILNAYKRELSLNNIHYIYHCRWPMFRNRLVSLLSRINFTVTAPIDTGVGTAFLGSIGIGLIPVGYSDMEGSDEDSCLASDWSIPAIKECLIAASEKSTEWCSRASMLNIEKYERLHNPEAFGANFRSYLSRILFSDTHQQRVVHGIIDINSKQEPFSG